MERRRAGQGAGEKALEGMPTWVQRHLPTFARAVAATDEDRRSWVLGERGEQKVARSIEPIVGRAGGKVIYDVQLDNENIDVVAVLPTGLFVVEVKHWSGRATFKGDVVFHGSRKPHRIHAQVERQRRKLVELLDLKHPVDGVIVLVPNGDLTHSGSPTPGTTPVVYLRGLAEHLVGTRRRPRPIVHAPHEVAGLAVLVNHGRKIGAVPVDGL